MTDRKQFRGQRGAIIDGTPQDAGVCCRRGGDTADGNGAAAIGPLLLTKRHRRILAAGVAIALAAGCFAAAHDAPHGSASANRSSTGLPAGSNDEAAYLVENDAAMTKMMTDMSIKPTGDVDADFVGMMVPHHQGAVDMARAELRYGHNEQLRRIAQEIVVEQMQEIAAMHLALGQPLPPSIASPTQPAPVAGAGERPVAHDPTKMPHDSTMNQEP